MDNKVKNLLGLAFVAKKIVLSDTALKCICSNKCSFALIANDASEKSIKKYTDKCKFYNVAYNLDFNTEELSDAIGKYNRKLVAITDIGFSKKIKNELGRRGIDG
jgi:ribosomal protein L7Ae-like RNA K-turn-binding protein